MELLKDLAQVSTLRRALPANPGLSPLVISAVLMNDTGNHYEYSWFIVGAVAIFLILRSWGATSRRVPGLLDGLEAWEGLGMTCAMLEYRMLDKITSDLILQIHIIAPMKYKSHATLINLPV